jgi:hypothetical protein
LLRYAAEQVPRDLERGANTVMWRCVMHMQHFFLSADSR